ncbi:hypothetical protein HZT23_27565 (plasmid) [Klebsiella quasipneumoniae]|uniref:hypothetical protein n=1 Tax=Klebsiella pneumoniae complex TaxID=3390273 RepID=UPI0013C2E241|nr:MULTISPECIES: hypothetical protein [Klebsiella]MBC4425488.1 hypothetical protein [Klebsiella variicola]MCC4959773.1 hypothetical protein [Klebsiella pneumoniae]MCD7091180.1 hypothetical protein [Klebsiella quasipneumoniae subsp. quasipneumoniae]UMU52099.1 hypothetical protein HZT23_27565 [Klebsiella quasipneumoniae]
MRVSPGTPAPQLEKSVSSKEAGKTISTPANMNWQYLITALQRVNQILVEIEKNIMIKSDFKILSIAINKIRVINE